jgi:hypothetical protein
MTTLIIRGLALLLLISTDTLLAQVPQLLSYQGRVVVGTTNFDGSGQFKFALVNASGSTTYWSNDGSSTAGSEPIAAVALTVIKGLYSVQLGDTTLTNMTAVPASVFNNPDVRLRVWFNDGVNGSQMLAPDQRIAAVGYAIVAGTVPDGSITSAKIASGAIGSSQLGTGLTLSGNLTGNVTGNLTGNADTATSASTAGSATSFTGSLAGDVTGTQSATVVANVGGVSAANVAAGVSLANAATSAATPGTLVARDGGGNITANSFTSDNGIYANGNISTSSGNITSFGGLYANDDISTARGGISALGNIVTQRGDIYAGGSFTAGGSIVTSTGYIYAGGSISGGSLAVNGNIATSSGDIYAGGSISGGSLAVNGSISGGNISASGSITGGNLNINGAININGGSINNSGELIFNSGGLVFRRLDGQPFITGSQSGLYVTGDLVVGKPDGQDRIMTASMSGLTVNGDITSISTNGNISAPSGHLYAEDGIVTNGFITAVGDISTGGNLNASSTITLSGPTNNTSGPISLSNSNGNFTFTTNNFSTVFNHDGTVSNPNNSTTWNVASDRRLKTGIKPIASALDTLGRIKPVLFRYNADFLDKHPSTKAKEHFGVIAQEYEEVFPEFVTQGADGYLSVDASPLPFVIAAAVKELHLALSGQTEEVAALKQRNELLEKRLAELETKDKEREEREQALALRLAKLEQFIPASPKNKPTTAALKKGE